MGCGNNQVKVDSQFYYYPDKNVYYDSGKKYFLYSLDGAKTWVKFNSTNSGQPVALGGKVLIYTSDPKVYNENEKHRKLYAGRLYAINTSDTVTSIASPEVMERNKVVKKRKPEVKRQVTDKPKSGIGKFIDKIFRKKK